MPKLVIKLQPEEVHGGSAVEQTAVALTESIISGIFKPGQRLPSIRKLVSEHGVSYHTAVKAYKHLVSTGLASSNQGRGFFVEAQLPEQCHQGVAGTLPISEGQDANLGAFWRIFHADANTMKLGSGWLPPSWHDTDSLARIIRRTASFARSTLVEYGDPLGYLPLRKNLARHLHYKLGLALSPAHILTTLGATQALDLVIRKLISPGDVVLVDDPCNGSLVQLLLLQKAEVIGIPRGPEGPDINALEQVLASKRVKAFFINSIYHNPTGSSLSSRNAFQLLQLAYRHDIVIVEDDVYGDFADNQHNRLVTMDGLQKTIYIGSFSKTLSASLRVGYLVAPASLISAFANMKLLTSVAVPSFCERSLSAILSDEIYHKHLRLLRQKLQTHQATAQSAFKRWGWEIYHEPSGGMFLWVRHAAITRIDAFVERAHVMGILLVPGSAFTADRSATSWWRINVAHLDVGRAAALFDLGDKTDP